MPPVAISSIPLKRGDSASVVAGIHEGYPGPFLMKRPEECPRPLAALADGAPVGRAVVVALPAGEDRRPAARARPPRLAVDRACRTRTGDRPAHLRSRPLERAEQLGVRRRAEREPGGRLH